MVSALADPQPWRKINLATWSYFLFCVVVIAVSDRTYFNLHLRELVPAALGVGFGRLTEHIGNLIDGYAPSGSLDAKRTNEQIKSLSTTINALALGGVSILVLADIAKEPMSPDWPKIALASAAAIYIHHGARRLLGYLKDETPGAYPVN